MKIGKEELEGFAEILGDIENVRPIVRMAVDALKSFGPELAEIPDGLCAYVRKNRIAGVKEYIEAGFSKKDAILLTIADSTALKQVIQGWNKANK